jgi:hypothetical protein
MNSDLFHSVDLAFFLPQVFSHRHVASEDIEMSKAQFSECLERLNEKLKERRRTLTFLLVGGGAMALAYDARETTHDLDGQLYPKSNSNEVLLYRLRDEVTAEMEAEGKTVNYDWINTAVRHIMDAQKWELSYFQPLPQFSYSNLKLMAGKPDYLLAMKCQAFRPERKDYRDIVTLLQKTDVKSLDDLEKITRRYFSLEEWLGNSEQQILKTLIALAWPGQTQYEDLRQRVIQQTRARRGQL